MHFSKVALLAALSSLGAAQHGEGEEGSSMGPVAFLWPSDRPWTAQDDNVAPCGSPNGPGNRTEFPLSQGSVALSIADDAYHVAFRLSVSNDPQTQAEFDDQIVSNVTDIDPGHQCYKIDRLEGIEAGRNATIQLEYWAEYEGENNGRNQSFFACADITFVETINFSSQMPCFNVTSEEFDAPTPTGSGSSSTPSATAGTELGASSAPESSSGGSGGLSTGAKAGIAVGAVIGGLALIGALGFFFWRRGKTAGLKGKDAYELRAKDLTTTPAESERTASERNV
ncbi:hypothetical protein BS50DRAFT_58924 [Corynespora cassiicola Philippines]|uniref:Copper acquisition factor BIM1-like domain-containing protein n=1 Tax=Corynespora cassiicola Philippines TaxID=1448308 RepID=A0A2T2NJ50_CORCC|nr:hypothetical protein BS50DRAFT_58924 [Corynespora cassiicola Philippines]